MRFPASPWMLATAGASQPARLGAVVTPTRLRGLRAMLRRLADRLRGRVHAERLPAFDSATLRDLGLSHMATLAHGGDPYGVRRGSDWPPH